MAEFIRKGRKWGMTWLIIWGIMFAAVIVAYPCKPSFWGGWFPSSVVITFGLMVAVYILARIFCDQRFRS